LPPPSDGERRKPKKWAGMANAGYGGEKRNCGRNRYGSSDSEHTILPPREVELSQEKGGVNIRSQSNPKAQRGEEEVGRKIHMSRTTLGSDNESKMELSNRTNQRLRPN